MRADDEAELVRPAQRLSVSREVRGAVVQSLEAGLLRLRDLGVDDHAYDNLLLELDHGARIAASSPPGEVLKDASEVRRARLARARAAA